AGPTATEVYSQEAGQKLHRLKTERFTAVRNVSYTRERPPPSVAYTANLYGPMRLRAVSETDPRTDKAPWWSIQNIQLTKAFRNGIEVYGGVKNLLDWTPNRGNPFIIARSHDPFDKLVDFDGGGQAVITSENPYGLTFDPSYVFGPNQGAR